MAKFIAIIFAYMLSVSSAFANDNNIVTATQNSLAKIIASEQGVTASKLRVVILQGLPELKKANSDSLRVLSLKIDEKSGRFYAIISNGLTKFPVSGKIEKTQQVPVISRMMKKGEVINAADIAYIDVSEKIISRGIVTNADDLVGKEVAKVINANRPIMPHSLTNPTLIKRDAMVNTTFKSNVISISENLIALEDGALGDVIRLKNTSSNKVVRGKITGANTAEIASLDGQIASK